VRWLAQTLTDLGTVQALLANERSLRNVAKGEGLNVVGSLWVIRLLYESNEIDLPMALAFPDIVAKRGQHYSTSLIMQFRASLTQAR
jgi:predicted nucleic acid-binding protein